MNNEQLEAFLKLTYGGGQYSSRKKENDKKIDVEAFLEAEYNLSIEQIVRMIENEHLEAVELMKEKTGLLVYNIPREEGAKKLSISKRVIDEYRLNGSLEENEILNNPMNNGNSINMALILTNIEADKLGPNINNIRLSRKPLQGNPSQDKQNPVDIVFG